jgi:hypothetical protein
MGIKNRKSVVRDRRVGGEGFQRSVEVKEEELRKSPRRSECT